jgi:hypothetical protein
MWKRIAIYSALLAAGILALQWFDYQRLARVHSGELYYFLIAAAFLVLGIVIGVRVMDARHPPVAAAIAGAGLWRRMLAPNSLSVAAFTLGEPNPH